MVMSDRIYKFLSNDKIASAIMALSFLLLIILDQIFGDLQEGLVIFLFLVCHIVGWYFYNTSDDVVKGEGKVCLNDRLYIISSWILVLACSLAFLQWYIQQTIPIDYLALDWFMLVIMIESSIVGYGVYILLFRGDIPWDTYREEMTYIAAAFTILSLLAFIYDFDEVFKSEYGLISTHIGTWACTADAILSLGSNLIERISRKNSKG